MTQNIWYNYTVNVNPPDGIKSVINAIIFFDAHINSTRKFTIMVNNQMCNSSIYSTTYATSSQARIYFDCANVITRPGVYNVSLGVTGGNIGATIGWLELTYMNDPKADVFMHETEYNANTLGKVWLQLLDNQKKPITNATCLLDIYYPDNEDYIHRAMMKHLEKGIYYYDFITPNYEGVYPAIAECFYVTNSTSYRASSGTILAGTNKANTYTATWFNDNIVWEVEEAGGTVSVMFNFTNITQPQFLNFIDITWSGIWKKEAGDVAVDNVYIYVWNYTNSSWQRLPNYIYYSGTEYMVTNTIETSNLSASGVWRNGSMAVMLKDSVVTGDKEKTKLKTDYIAVSTVNLASGEFQEVRGSSEVHIHDALGYYMVGVCPLTGAEFDEYSACSYFTDDDEYQELEGEIESRIRIYSTTMTQKETYFVYETPQTVDCSALYWIKAWNGTHWVNVTDYRLSSNLNKENCLIYIPITLEKDGVYDYWFKFDNYLKWEVLWTKDLIDYIAPKMQKVCYAINSTHSYSVPINNSTYLGEGATRYCHRIFDDIYWFYDYYNNSVQVNLTGEYLSYLSGVRFYKRALYDHLIALNQYMNNISIGNISVNATFDDSNIISAVNNLHSSIVSVNNTVLSVNNTLSYQISQIPYLVWNFASRTLTEFNFLVDLTTDSINSILNPIFTNFNILNSRMNSIEEKIDELNLLTYQLNQSIFYELNNQYYMLQNINQSIYENNQELKQKIDYVNQSIYQLNQNVLSVNNSIYLINNSLASEIDNIYSISKEINQTLQSLNISFNVSIEPSDIWNYPNRTLTYYPQYNDTELKQMILSLSSNISQHIDNINYNLLYVNQTILSKIGDLNSSLYEKIDNCSKELQEIKLYLPSMNQTLVYKINQLNQSLYEIRDEIIQEIIDNALTAKQVWEYAYRNLTYYPEFNYSEMASQVWNYQNRTLTVYQNITLELEGIMDALSNLNNTVISSYSNLSQSISSVYGLVNDTYSMIIETNNSLYLVNSSIVNQILSMPEVNYSQIASYVWVYENRSLTDLNVNVSVNVTVDDSKIYAINSSLANLINYNFNNTNGLIYALDSNMANNFTYTLSQLYNLNGTIEYYISNSTNNLTAYIQNITILTAEDVWAYQIRTLTTAVNVSAGNISTVENAYATFTDVRYAGATEYASGELSQISYLFLNTLSGNPEPITNGNCYLDVYYPNKTKMISSQLMFHLENGLYHYNFTAPSYSGVYTSRVYCSNGTFSGIGASTFHIAPWANAIFLLQTNSSQQYSNLLNYLLLKDADVFTEKVCLNNNTLGIRYVFNVSINGDKIPIEKTEKIYCQNGCDNGKCMPKSELNLLTFGLVTLFGLGLVLIPKNIIFQILGALVLIIESVYLLSSGIEVASLDLLGTSYSYVLNNTITLLIALTLLGIALVKLSLSFNLFRR